MARVFNFSAGPSTLPVEALEKAAKEILDYKGSGMSVMEMSHRSAIFQSIMEETESLFRKTMNVPDNYKVLFLQGGAWTQFAMIPLNLKNKGKAGYIDTGNWSDKAFGEGKQFIDAKVIASSKDQNYTEMPKIPDIDQDLDYLHITSNNTIFGTKYNTFPETGNVPLVADMSSNIMSEVIDVSKFGVIYAGAQKNLGPAGVTIVIIREDLIKDTQDQTPTMLKYKTHAAKGSLHNTPPSYSIYMVKLVLEWINSLGGVKAVEKNNKEKAEILYNYLDQSELFKGTVKKEDRSLMNVPFVLPTSELDAKFIKEAEEKGFVNLKGYRTVGGMRASIYNAMPLEGVKKLVELMVDFEAKNK